MIENNKIKPLFSIQEFKIRLKESKNLFNNKKNNNNNNKIQKNKKNILTFCITDNEKKLDNFLSNKKSKNLCDKIFQNSQAFNIDNFDEKNLNKYPINMKLKNIYYYTKNNNSNFILN